MWLFDGYESWSLILSLRMSEQGAKEIKRIYETKKKEVTGDWRKWHKGDLHNILH
jgi:hypothetical protein